MNSCEFSAECEQPFTGAPPAQSWDKTGPSTQEADKSKVPCIDLAGEPEESQSLKADASLPESRFKLRPEQSYKKETKASRLGKSTGRWTQKEHVLFIEGLKIYGKNWKKVESYIGTRTGTQIRSHAQKFFNRIRKEFSTEDPSKYVIDNMSDETIKRIVLEHWGDDVSNSNEGKDILSDTPEALFSITKENKPEKSRTENNEDSPKSIGASGSAFKSFKREIQEDTTSKEDSKIYSTNRTVIKPIWTKPAPSQKPQGMTLNQISGSLNVFNQNASSHPAQLQQLPFDRRAILLQALLGGNQIGLPNGQQGFDLNSTLLNLLLTLKMTNNIT